MASASIAPLLRVPEREIVAVEHPMVINNIDKGLETLATPADQLIYPDSYDSSVAVYLRPGDRSCAPILSHNVPSSNVVLKVTVPKKTGRKRKRGTQDPFMTPEELGILPTNIPKDPAISLCSHSRQDTPSKIRRTLQDNIGSCKVEPVGIIGQTHRFRGLADFHFSTAHAPFVSKVRDTVITGDYEKIKQFKFDLSQGPKYNDEVVPPPRFTDHSIPFNWGYKQNQQITVAVDKATGEKVLLNSSIAKKINTQYVSATVDTVPLAPLTPPDLNDSEVTNMITSLNAALDERPCWSRRALSNRLGKTDGQYLFKECLQYVGYQFRGGPWRDSVIKFGIDPRTDPKYRVFQTVFFKIFKDDDRKPGMPWQDVRSEYTRRAIINKEDLNTHLFDGKSVHLDGKLWQICDITDPICLGILATDKLRNKVELDSDGWYCNGTMAKLKAVMRCKISAIGMGRHIPDKAFAGALSFPDEVTERKYMNVPVPDFRGSKAEQQQWLKDNPGMTLPKNSAGQSVRVRGKGMKKAMGPALAAGAVNVDDDESRQDDGTPSIAGDERGPSVPPGAAGTKKSLRSSKTSSSAIPIDPRLQQTLDALAAQSGEELLPRVMAGRELDGDDEDEDGDDAAYIDEETDVESNFGTL